jgi:hypothetical protein
LRNAVGAEGIAPHERCPHSFERAIISFEFAALMIILQRLAGNAEEAPD